MTVAEVRSIFAWRVAASIITIVILSLSAKCVIALTTYGTNDVASWASFAWTIQESGGVGLYHSASTGVSPFIHPPFMIHVLRLIDLTASKTGLPFPFWLRLPAIVADVASTCLVWKVLVTEPRLTIMPRALMLLAAAPASIMISGFHGNTDAEMIFFVLLSVYLLERVPSGWLAGGALGMGVNIKLIPLIFLPAIMLYLSSFRKRTEFLLAACLVIFVGSLPYVVEDPVYISRRILGYRSIYGQWGISRFLSQLPSGLSVVNSAYYVAGPYVVLAAICVAAVWMNRIRNQPPLFVQCGLISFLFMTLSPGFSVQYLAWLVPWVVVLGSGPMLILYVPTGVFLFFVYTFWSRGLPWYFANAWAVGPWRGWLVCLEILSWISVLVVLILFVRMIGRRCSRSPDPRECGVASVACART